MTSKYKKFRFENYHYDFNTNTLVMHFSYDGIRHYTEKVHFQAPQNGYRPNKDVIDALCFYTFIIAGSSYYKSFVASEIEIVGKRIDYWQAGFFNMIYRGGLSQFVYENSLSADDLAKFKGEGKSSGHAVEYDGAGVLLMQSGGKDSLLSSELMKLEGNEFVSWHMSSTGKYPPVLDEVGAEVIVSRREFNLDQMKQDWKDGAMNGHVPFSALYAGFALIQAALIGKNLVVASNESSSDQANVEIEGYKINHQFTKTFEVEQAIENYLRRYVSEDIHYGSILRPLNELQVGKLFARYAWPKYRSSYSSCNLANYKQGKDDGNLTWDGTCPKCANTFLILAPFVDKSELLEVFDGKNLLQDKDLTHTYEQLMGRSGDKPFECVGTFEELSLAYKLAVEKDPDYKNPELDVMEVEPIPDKLGPYQEYFNEFIKYKKYI